MSDFFDKHPAIATLALIVGSAIAIMATILFCLTVSLRMETTEKIRVQEEKARICQETGYGCFSSDLNIDYTNKEK